MTSRPKLRSEKDIKSYRRKSEKGYAPLSPRQWTGVAKSLVGFSVQHEKSRRQDPTKDFEELNEETLRT